MKNYVILLISFFFEISVYAQVLQVPHSRLHTDENTTFPYEEPIEVGVDPAKLETISDEILKWVRNGDLVGGELLILKGENTILHETYGCNAS
jgi:hypothetical protein